MRLGPHHETLAIIARNMSEQNTAFEDELAYEVAHFRFCRSVVISPLWKLTGSYPQVCCCLISVSVCDMVALYVTVNYILHGT